MAKRCVSKFVVDNTDFPIMQISDFSIIPNRVDNSAYQYSYYHSLQPPSGVSSVGNSFNSMVGDIITSGSVVKNVENFNNVTVGRYYEYGYGHQINSIYVNDENSNMLFGFGAYIDNEERDCTYYASIILDDDSEYADVITMYSYVSRGWTKLWHYGGNGTLGKKLYQYFNDIIKFTSNGGGATHIAKVTGQLKDLSSNLSDILMVSGGGGGGCLVNENAYNGADAGGISGSGNNSGNQSSGYAFGQGESGTNESGGGSGLYGGYKGTSSKSGGAGSGYIGNSLVSNKKMVGYNVPTSDAEGTKTESVSTYSANYVANQPKAGNGHARIKYLATYKEYTFEELIKTDDLTHYKETWVGSTSVDDNWSTLSQWLDTEWNLASQNGYGTYQLVKDDDEYILGTTSRLSMSLYALPLKNKIKVKALIFDGKFNTLTNVSQTQMHLRMGCTNNGVHSIVGALTVSQGDGYDYKVNDTNYHTFTKQFDGVETNYLEFYNSQYKDYFKNIKVIVEE